MSKVMGVIDRFNSKPTRNGGTSYSVMVNGEWFSTFDKIDASEGMSAEFEYVQKGQYKNIVGGTFKTTSAPKTSSGSSAGSAPAPGQRDISILHQSSRKDAIALVSGMLAADKVALPAAKGKQHDAILALVDQLTVRFYLDTTKAVKDGGVTDEDQAAPSPEEFE